MQIRPSYLLARVFLRLVGHGGRSLAIGASGLVLDGYARSNVAFGEIANRTIVHKGWIFSTLAVPLVSGDSINIHGVRYGEAQAFAQALDIHWQVAIQATLAKQQTEIEQLNKAIAEMAMSHLYPSACRVQPIVERAEALFQYIPSNLPSAVLTLLQRVALAPIAKFHLDPHGARAKAIEHYMATHLANLTNLNKTAQSPENSESQSLTAEQCRAVVTDEEATLILAGAGAGKTRVITAKADYLIEQNIRQASEILMMTFTTDAAKEMEERLKNTVAEDVHVSTVHALANHIIGAVEGYKPALIEHAIDEKRYRTLLRDLTTAQIRKSEKTFDLVKNWFVAFFHPYRSEWDFETIEDYLRYTKEVELRTLQGELVKSFEELTIANWLYVNGIDYEYEPVYEHQNRLRKSGRGVYRPDFRLTASGIYIEHFGVRKQRNAEGRLELETREDIDCTQYRAAMRWKRNVHRRLGTVLIRTYSSQQLEGRLIRSLVQSLRRRPEFNKATYLPRSRDALLQNLQSKRGHFDIFTNTLGRFLNLYKGGQLTIAECEKHSKVRGHGARGAAFLRIFESVYRAYQAYLDEQEKIDFEDMINRATAHVESRRYQSPFRHILVDEFQDVSMGLARLLHVLKAQNSDTHIFAVGDDWQSIYRFSGADVSVVRGFAGEFGGYFAGRRAIHATVDLGRTFRNPSTIALPAQQFITQNPDQIAKIVQPAHTSDEPAIHVRLLGDSADSNESSESNLSNYERDIYKLDEREEILRLLQNIAAQDSHANAKPSSVLLLGRYNHVLPDGKDRVAMASAVGDSVELEFKTIHKAKGLEADHVIIVHAEDRLRGLPAKMVDDPVLNIVLPPLEKYKHAEERRLFYVALTRARQSVTILAPRERPSIFIEELQSYMNGDADSDSEAN